MMNKIKKVLGSVLLSAMMISTMGSVTAFANNSTDTSYNFTFENAQRYTDARAKQDTSKLYMKCNSITSNTSYTAHAVGCTSATSTKVDCSRGNSYTFATAGTYYYMTSWVKENGYNYARIACNPNYGYKFTASGKWSPDNVNKY